MLNLPPLPQRVLVVLHPWVLRVSGAVLGAFPYPACLRRWVEAIFLSRCVPARLPLGVSASEWGGEVTRHAMHSNR